MAKPFLYIDFEFYGSNERILNLVCCSVWDGVGTVENWWLWQEGTARLREWLLARKDTHVICCYGAIAEARSFISLGLDPSQFKWVDLFLEVRQLQNACDKHEYGVYFKDGKKRKSVPPKRDDRGMVIEDGKDHFMLEQGLAAAVASLLGECIDAEHKDAMRDRILAKGPYNEEDRAAIMEYCASDIALLPRLWDKIRSELLNIFYQGNTKELAKAVFNRGMWAVDCAVMESCGIPLYLPRLYSISQNHTNIVNDMIENLCTNYYPFFIKEKVKGGFKWVQKYASFKKWIEDNGLKDKWPLTDGGKTGMKNYSGEEKILESYSHFPAIKEFMRVRKGKNQLNSLRPDALDGFLSNVGSDARLRTFFSPNGTISGRNTPRSSVFVPAMASFLRCLIRPRPGRVLTTCDYSSQEFLIASLLAQDDTMKEAYYSGDPYMFFAIQVGAAPANATKETHGDVRNTFKGVILGKQYGLGVVKLRDKISYDAGRQLSMEEAEELNRYHRETFSTYWDFIYDLRNRYTSGEVLKVSDGLCLGIDNPSITSISNWPVQTTAAVILKKAVRKCHDAGMQVVYTLHDAITVEHDEDDKETPLLLKKLMIEAFDDEFPNAGIRVDTDSYDHYTEYVPPKAKKAFNSMIKYFDLELEAIQYDVI